MGVSRWWAVGAAALVGVAHEGPWGKIHGKWLFHGAMGDHDLTDGRGGPCAGYFDIFWFVIDPLMEAIFHVNLAGLLLDVAKWGAGFLDLQQTPPWWNGPMIPFPNILPPRGIPGPGDWLPRL